MNTVLLLIHLFVTITLIGVVLIQRSEGGGLGIGTSQGMGAFMSGRGTANLLTRTTAILAAIFFALSLALALLNRGSGGPGRSILDTPPITAPAPAAPTTKAPAAKAPAAPPAPGLDTPAPAIPPAAPAPTSAPTAPAPTTAPVAPPPAATAPAPTPAAPPASPAPAAPETSVPTTPAPASEPPK